MVDPITALSIASSVVQFVDYSTKLLSKSSELYKHGSLADNDELELVTKDLTRLTGDLLVVGKKQQDDPDANDPEETALRELARLCNDIGQQLLAQLGTLKVAHPGNKLEHGLESISKAVRSSWKRSKVENIEKRLRKVREELDTRILALINNKSSRLQVLLSELLAENRRTEISISNKIDQLQREITQAVEQAYSRRNDLKGDAFATIGAKCLDLAEEGVRVASSQQVLRSLHFKSIRMRQNAIKEAHKKTFEWVFDEGSGSNGERPRFLEWLISGTGIYWVSGKAGSGKSTLMKLLCDHESTMAALKTWAEPGELGVASFFFWSAGNKMQKSQQGLLQTILLQVLRHCPDLIPMVCPSRWDGNDLNQDVSDPWTYQELLQSFQRLAKLDSLSARFCFFIDGLDEYDGEEIEIIKVLRGLITSERVKICASSRPWNAFEKAFGAYRHQMFRLQDFTEDDIRLYVSETLGEDQSFQSKKSSDPQYELLIEEIVEKSNGVFLWVYLVVRSLLRGLSDDNNIELMRRRLYGFPSDLDSYFNQMMDTIEDIYQEESAHIFQVVVNAKSPLSTLSFWFLAQGRRSPGYALEAKIETMPDEEVIAISENMRVHLNACCKDLLQVTVDNIAGINFMQCRVDFLHRTVRDFLMQESMRILIEKRSKQNFNVRAELCRLSLAQIKALPDIPLTYAASRRIRTQIEHLVCDLISYAYETEIHDGVPETLILNELEIAFSTYLNSQNAKGANLGGFKDFDSHEFLATFVKAGLCLYVAQRLDEQPELISGAANKPSLLEITLNMPASNSKLKGAFKADSLFNFDIAKVLLLKGADPNDVFVSFGKQVSKGLDSSPSRLQQETVWTAFLGMCRQRQTDFKSRSFEVFQVAELFVRHGADLDVAYSETYKYWVKGGRRALPTLQLLRGTKATTEPHAAILSEKTQDVYPLEILQGVLLPGQLEQIVRLIEERKRSSSSGIWRWLGWKEGSQVYKA